MGERARAQMLLEQRMRQIQQLDQLQHQIQCAEEQLFHLGLGGQREVRQLTSQVSYLRGQQLVLQRRMVERDQAKRSPVYEQLLVEQLQAERLQALRLRWQHFEEDQLQEAQLAALAREQHLMHQRIVAERRAQQRQKQPKRRREPTVQMAPGPYEVELSPATSTQLVL